VSGLIENLKGLGNSRLMLLGGVGASLVAVIVAVAVAFSRPSMAPLFSGLDPAEAAQIVRVVEQMGVPVSLAADGSAISVPRADFARVRMAVAEKGLPSKGGSGWELFDTGGALGMTSFMQKVNRLRAMEGELARTVQALRGVEAARVHLVLPDREAFSREAPTPTASVVVRTRSGYSMERAQAVAVRHLVSSAVPGLKPSGVTVMDANGELILVDDGSGKERPGVAADGMRASIEQRVAKSIEQMLSARVGPGNVRVQVSAEVDMRKEMVRSERYNPQEQVVRSTQTVEDTERSAEGERNVSVQQNLPNAPGAAGGGGTRSDRNRTEETVNYEISRTVTESTVEPGQIKRLTVAVLVNGVMGKDDGGKPSYRDRDQAELDRIRALVQSAMGYSSERGDTVTVDSLQFVDYALDLSAPVGLGVGEILAENVMTIVQWAVMLALAAMVLLLGVRPLIGRVFSHVEEEKAARKAAADAARAAEEAEAAAEAAKRADPHEDEMASINGVHGQVQALKIKRLADIIEDNPDQALKVMKAWIAPEIH